MKLKTETWESWVFVGALYPASTWDWGNIQYKVCNCGRKWLCCVQRQATACYNLFHNEPLGASNHSTACSVMVHFLADYCKTLLFKEEQWQISNKANWKQDKLRQWHSQTNTAGEKNKSKIKRCSQILPQSWLCLYPPQVQSWFCLQSQRNKFHYGVWNTPPHFPLQSCTEKPHPQPNGYILKCDVVWTCKYRD